MQDIRDAILSGDRTRGDVCRAVHPRVLPRRDRAQGRGGDVRGHGQQGQGPPQVACTSTTCRCPSSRPVRRSSPSWPAPSTTTPCGPRSSSRCRRSGSSSATAAPRSSPSGTTCPTTWSVPTSPASCCAPARRHQVEARPGGRRALPVGRARGRRRPQRHDARPAAADLGLRDQLRRARRAGDRQVQPADAQARPPDVGGGGLARAGELHGIPAAHLQERRRHEARRPRPDLGRLRRPRLLRHPDGPVRWRHPDLRRLLAREGRRSAATWAPS